MSATALREHTQTASAEPTKMPLRRVVEVELHKMFDTRSGWWLMASTALTAVLATTVVVLLAPDDQLTYNTFAAAVGIPLTIVLPIIATLSVTSEWSQRSGLTTFTLVPRRSRVIAAKAIATVVVAGTSMAVAFGVGAVGNVVGSAASGNDAVWDMTWAQAWTIPLGNVLGMLLGFTFGLLLRNSAAAIVLYLLYALVLPPLTGMLAAAQAWFADLQPWIDFAAAHAVLFDGVPTATQLAHLSVATVVWMGLPLGIGFLLLNRSEVK
jgi:hypothetical protein